MVIEINEDDVCELLTAGLRNYNETALVLKSGFKVVNVCPTKGIEGMFTLLVEEKEAVPPDLPND